MDPQMQVAISGEMNWGMRDDIDAIDPDEISEVNWRIYQAWRGMEGDEKR
jgi:hypothetical protein